MDAIINLGKPAKDIERIVGRLVQATAPSRRMLKITGASVFYARELNIVSPLYGAGMVLDSLQELWEDRAIEDGSRLILVGSMGSLSREISFGKVIAPNPCVCAYYGFAGTELHQDPDLLSRVRFALREVGQELTEYRHGSSFAVYDPHTDHSTYTSSLYGSSVLGVDCGEAFIGLEFARRKGLAAAVALYCSDDPDKHISDIGYGKFIEMESRFDLLLNTAAAQALAD